MAKAKKLTEDQFWILNEVLHMLYHWDLVESDTWSGGEAGYHVCQVMGFDFLSRVEEVGLKGLTFHAADSDFFPTVPTTDDYYEYMDEDEMDDWERRAKAFYGEDGRAYDLWVKENKPKYDKGMDTIYSDLVRFVKKYGNAYKEYVEELKEHTPWGEVRVGRVNAEDYYYLFC